MRPAIASPRRRRPLCLLDVDGVIALLGPGDGEPTFDAVVAGFPVIIAEAMPARLARLLRQFHLIWATAWGRAAAEELGPLLGLSAELPVVRFDPDTELGLGTYKLRAVQAVVRDRACAWVDDELGPDVVVWAEQRDQPTLLVHTDPRFGLTDAHVEQLLQFAAEAEAPTRR